MFGLPKIPFGLYGIADGTGTRPNNTAEDTASLQKAYADVMARNRTPNGRVARAFDAFGPTVTQPFTGTPTGGTGTPMDAAPPLPAPINVPAMPPIVAQADRGPVGPTSVGGAPLDGYPGVTPQAAPAPYGLSGRLREAQASLGGEDMGFFKRNSAMMRDPSTGDFLDPQAAKSAEATGPDLIQKFMSYLHTK